MATDIERLAVVLEANIKRYEKEMARTRQVTDQAMRQVEQSAQRSMKRLEGILSNGASVAAMGFNRIGGAVAGALSVNALKSYADSWTESANKIAAAGEETSRVAQRQKELADLAIKTRSEFSATVDLYTGLTRSTAELGVSQAQVAQATETINKAFAVGGQSASTAAGAILQFNQAMASGALRGDELNSILEGAPPLARLIAKEFGVSVGELKKLGENGDLVSGRVLKAILNGSQQINAEFAKTAPTIAQSFTNLNTALTAYIGQADQASGSSAKIAGFINGIATNAETAIPALVAFGVALAAATGGLSAVASTVAGGATALYLLSDALRPVAGDMATLGDYARVAFDTVSTLSVEAAGALRAAFAGAADLITNALSTVGIDGGEAFGVLVEVVKRTANAIIGSFSFVSETVKATWNTLGFAMAEAVIEAMNAAIRAIENMANAAVAAVNNVTAGINSALGTSLSQISSVDLGRIDNAYSGAGRRAAEAYSNAFGMLTKDYIGNAIQGTADIAAKWRDAANLRAADRAEQARRNSQQNYAPGSASTPGTGNIRTSGSGDGKKEKLNELEREIKAIERRREALEAERQTVGMSAGDTARAEAAFRLLEAAKQANVAITPTLLADIDAMAAKYGEATQAIEDARNAQQAAAEAIRDFQSTAKDAVGSFISDIRRGESAADAFANTLDRLADKMIDMTLNSLFSTGGSGGGGFGSLLSSLFQPLGPALKGGGMVRGPGTGTSDSITARLSNGEFVVNAKATSQYRDLLERINSGQMPRFASGGYVGAGSMPTRAGGGNVVVNITNNADAQVSQKSTKTAGGMQLDVMIDQIVGQKLATPGTASNRAVRTYGGGMPPLTRR